MSSRTNLTPEDWINAAQRVLVKSGVDAVRVDTLAKELKITRGSFYYHFHSRDELLEGILSLWRSRATEGVIRQISHTQTSPQEQLAQLLELPLHGRTAKEAAAIELAIRAWARRDQQARRAIDEVDNYRLSYIESLLLKTGVAPADAKDRAYLVYAYQLSLSVIQVETHPEELKKRSERIAELLIPATAADP